MLPENWLRPVSLLRIPTDLGTQCYVVFFHFAASSCETTSSTSSIGNIGSAEETGRLALFSFIFPTHRSSEQHSLRATLATNSYFRDGLLLNSKEKCGKLVQLFAPPPPKDVMNYMLLESTPMPYFEISYM
jgi:hypothetical protein